MPRFTPPKTNLLLILKTLAQRLNLSVLRVVADDSGLLAHVKIRVTRKKKSYQFQGTTSISLQRQLPREIFKEVVEVMIPELASNFPLLAGSAVLSDQHYVWTLEPITKTLIVRSADNGPVKFQEKRQLRRNGYTPGLLRQELVPEGKGDPRPGR
jgi:hypothetical protein